jgi:hypothetical protein
MTTPTPEQVMREKLERIAPVMYSTICKLDPEMSMDHAIQNSVMIANALIHECERVAREETK